MSGMMPFFLTGANAKIRIDDRTMAFCTNLSYSVRVSHQNPKILGMYEGHSIEPTGYEVRGNFTIIKYTEGMARMHDGLHGQKTPSGVNGRGNSIGAWRPKGRWNESITGAGDSGQSQQGLNPRYLNSSVMFDIEVYQKDPHGNDMPVARLKNCRVTQMDFQLSKAGVATQTYQFMAVYADDDTFVTSSSGVGQDLGA